jgi:hypothetical protein
MANTRRMNRLEELGRVDSEKAFTKKGKRNLKDEKKRIVRELNKKKDGGSLKPVDKEKNPGLAKLPTKVRNKMGYMKDGGKVKKDYKLGTKFQGDYKDKSLAGKAKEFVKTAAKQTAGTAKQIAKKIRTKKMGGGMMRKRPMMKSGGIAKKGMGCEIR